MSDPLSTEQSNVLFRLRRVKLAKSCMGLKPLIDDAAFEIEKLRAQLQTAHNRISVLQGALLGEKTT